MSLGVKGLTLCTLNAVSLIRMQERQVKEQQVEHSKKILKIQDQLKTNLSQVSLIQACQSSGPSTLLMASAVGHIPSSTNLSQLVHPL